MGATSHTFLHWAICRCRLQCVEVFNQALEGSLGFCDRRKHGKRLGIRVLLEDHLLVKVAFVRNVDLIRNVVKSADEFLVSANFRGRLRHFN